MGGCGRAPWEGSVGGGRAPWEGAMVGGLHGRAPREGGRAPREGSGFHMRARWEGGGRALWGTQSEGERNGLCDAAGRRRGETWRQLRRIW